MIGMANGGTASDRLNHDTAIVGISPMIHRAIDIARRFAASCLPILIIGDTGTGKELFAQEIHRWSGRRGRLVDVNCGALPRDLIEGELFGHRRGAYTGADTDSEGLICHASGGTLFLDELTALPLEGQVTLLRALETKEVRRLGDTGKRNVDFRLIGAMQEGISKQIEAGHFRRDLFQRVAGVVIRLPSLNERIEDVLPLATHFAAAHRRGLERGVDKVLRSHSWPGNIRELRVVIERSVILSQSLLIHRMALEEAIHLGGLHDDGIDEQSWAIRNRLLEAAGRHQGNRQTLANELGISVATLYRQLKRHRISLIR